MSEYFQKKPSAPGIRPSRETHRMTSHAAMVVGTIYCVDMDTATAANDRYATTTKTSVAGTGGENQTYCVCLEAASAIGEDVLCGFRGVFACLAGGAITTDLPIMANVAGEIIPATAGGVIIGKNFEATISDTTISDIWFDGTGSLGILHD